MAKQVIEYEEFRLTLHTVDIEGISSVEKFEVVFDCPGDFYDHGRILNLEKRVDDLLKEIRAEILKDFR